MAAVPVEAAAAFHAAPRPRRRPRPTSAGHPAHTARRCCGALRRVVEGHVASRPPAPAGGKKATRSPVGEAAWSILFGHATGGIVTFIVRLWGQMPPDGDPTMGRCGDPSGAGGAAGRGGVLGGAEGS